MRKAIEILLVGCIMTFSSASQQGEVIPPWVQKNMDAMRPEGVLMSYPDGLHAWRTPTRYELAVQTHASYLHIRELIHEAREANPRFSGALLAQTYARFLPGLLRCAKEFTPELAKLGVDVPGMKKDLAVLDKEVDELWSLANMATWATSPNP